VRLSGGRLARDRQLLGGRRWRTTRWLRGCRGLRRRGQLLCGRLSLRRRRLRQLLCGRLGLRRRRRCRWKLLGWRLCLCRRRRCWWKLLGWRLCLCRRLLGRRRGCLFSGRRRRGGRRWLSLCWMRGLWWRAGLLGARRRALIRRGRRRAGRMLRGLSGSGTARTLLRRARGARAGLFLLARIGFSRRAGWSRRRLRDDDRLIRRAWLRGDHQRCAGQEDCRNGAEQNCLGRPHGRCVSSKGAGRFNDRLSQAHSNAHDCTPVAPMRPAWGEIVCGWNRISRLISSADPSPASLGSANLGSAPTACRRARRRVAHIVTLRFSP
jgi:hypothetical protein